VLTISNVQAGGEDHRYKQGLPLGKGLRNRLNEGMLTGKSTGPQFTRSAGGRGKKDASLLGKQNYTYQRDG